MIKKEEKQTGYESNHLTSKLGRGYVFFSRSMRRQNLFSKLFDAIIFLTSQFEHYIRLRGNLDLKYVFVICLTTLFFSSNQESEFIFGKQNHNPLDVKCSFPYTQSKNGSIRELEWTHHKVTLYTTQGEAVVNKLLKELRHMIQFVGHLLFYCYYFGRCKYLN